ncbi:MAG: MGMT family protein [Cyanobacteriota bacterium]|nr:MGMT family protein [Cyanobacteriota bacterium]
MGREEAESERLYHRIYVVVRQIPQGQVATYGQVAELAGLIGQPRLVGYALYRLSPDQDDVPWQRVVNAKGEISHSLRRHGSDYRQRSLLEAEGIEFDQRDRIDLKRYRWQARGPLVNHRPGSEDQPEPSPQL